MSLPTNFSGPPGEELHRYFRNVVIEFKKMLGSSKDARQLEQEVDRFLDTSRQMNWHHKNEATYHKDAGDKAVAKVLNEATRYIQALQKKTPTQANPKDLLDALAEVERLILSQKAT